jgi:hypothetical protein
MKLRVELSSAAYREATQTIADAWGMWVRADGRLPFTAGMLAAYVKGLCWCAETKGLTR